MRGFWCVTMFGAYGDLSSVSARSLVHLVEETDELILCDSAPNLTLLGHSYE
jgi:hypothetical protein